MFKNRGYSAHRLLISFSSLIVVLLIITAFISYTSEIAREARVNMLKMTDLQLRSANRMLLSKATILNLHLYKELDASRVDKEYSTGILTYGEMLATTENLPIFLSLERLILKQGSHEGEVVLYTDEHRASACSLTYYQPFIDKKTGEVEVGGQAARYILNVEGC